MSSKLGPDDPTPNPDGPPSIECLWARIKRMETEARALRTDLEAEIRKLRADFSVTTESLKDDFGSLGARIELLEEDVTATKELVTVGNGLAQANNMLLQDIIKKLDTALVPK